MNAEVKILKRLLPRVFSKKLPKTIEIVKILGTLSQKINLIYRGKNKPADVLSFRYGKDYPVRSRAVHNTHGRHLLADQKKKQSSQKGRKNFKEIFSREASNGDYGEILVCPEVIRREAKKQGNTYKYQFTWMVLHGILHLAEIHHERSPKMAKRVAALEKRVLRKLFS